jgi:hypothetical protein
LRHYSSEIDLGWSDPSDLLAGFLRPFNRRQAQASKKLVAVAFKTSRGAV